MPDEGLKKIESLLFPIKYIYIISYSGIPFLIILKVILQRAEDLITQKMFHRGWLMQNVCPISISDIINTVMATDVDMICILF